jgi:hypothetical protein
LLAPFADEGVVSGFSRPMAAMVAASNSDRSFIVRNGPGPMHFDVLPRPADPVASFGHGFAVPVPGANFANAFAVPDFGFGLELAQGGKFAEPAPEMPSADMTG